MKDLPLSWESALAGKGCSSSHNIRHPCFNSRITVRYTGLILFASPLNSSVYSPINFPL